METLSVLAVLVVATAFRPDAGTYLTSRDKVHRTILAGSYPRYDLPTITAPIFRKDTVSISRLGAIADGLTLNTAIINYVSNCTFMGADVGLRLKTARGRGGVVENIFIDGIDMTDIAGEAILFDMYYAAKDPVPQQGESNELPEIPAQSLSESTPQFRAFQVRNVICKGAETAIMVRGLPEMAVKDIHIENAVLQARKGFVCIEAENIRLTNVSLITNAKMVMQIQNSRNLTLDKIQCADKADLLMHIAGQRSKDIRLLNTDTSRARKAVETEANVPINSLTTK